MPNATGLVSFPFVVHMLGMRLLLNILLFIQLGMHACLEEREGMGMGVGREYRMAGKFGGEFNLAVWRIMNAPPN